MSRGEQIVELRSQGKTYTEIIKEVKCARSVVSYHVNKSQGKDNLSIIKMINRNRKRSREMKIEGIKLKGGKCEKCGYNKCPAALQFHHLDPNIKDFTLASCKSKPAFFREIEKCILLCANCHAEEHFNNPDIYPRTDTA